MRTSPSCCTLDPSMPPGAAKSRRTLHARRLNDSALPYGSFYSASIAPVSAIRRLTDTGNGSQRPLIPAQAHSWRNIATMLSCSIAGVTGATAISPKAGSRHAVAHVKENRPRCEEVRAPFLHRREQAGLPNLRFQRPTQCVGIEADAEAFLAKHFGCLTAWSIMRPPRVAG